MTNRPPVQRDNGHQQPPRQNGPSNDKARQDSINQARQQADAARARQKADDNRRASQGHQAPSPIWQHQGSTTIVINVNNDRQSREQSRLAIVERLRRRADSENAWQERQRREEFQRELLIEAAADAAAAAQYNADQNAIARAEADREAALQMAADQAAADQYADDESDDSNVSDVSPFPVGDLPVNVAALVGRRYFSPANDGSYLYFANTDGMLFAGMYRNSVVVQPYQHLNCGDVSQVSGLIGGLNCSINPYGLEGDRSGSANLSFAMYMDARGQLAVAPLFDTDLDAWANAGAPLIFRNWTQQ